MSELSIGDAVGAGFQLIRRRPFEVLAWGLAGLVTAVATFGVFGSYYASVLGDLVRGGGMVNPMASPEGLASFQRMQGSSLLLSLFSAFVDCVVYCAVFRAVIHPEQRRFAYLRIGAPEVFALVLVIAGYVALVVMVVITILIIGAVVAGLMAAHAAAVGVIVGVLGGLALLAGLAYALLRLSLIVPMMVSDGRFHFADAWRLTSRHVGALLVVSIAIFAVLLVAQIVIGLIMLSLGLGYLSSAVGGLSHLREFFLRSPAEMLASAAPLLVIFGVMSIPLTGCTFAIVGAPWARAFRDLAGPDLAAAFS
jgi:hypothetical protein